MIAAYHIRDTLYLKIVCINKAADDFQTNLNSNSKHYLFIISSHGSEERIVPYIMIITAIYSKTNPDKHKPIIAHVFPALILE